MKIKSSDPSTAGAISTIKECAPKAYSSLFSKIYNDMSGFHDWRNPLLFIGGYQVLLSEKYSMQKLRGESPSLSHTDLTMSQITSGAIEKGCPLFFVHRDLMSACFRTSRPEGLEISEVEFPFDSFAFVLPKSGFLVPDGKRSTEELEFLYVYRDREGKTEHVVNDTYKVSVTSEDEGFFISTVLPRSFRAVTIRVDMESLKRFDSNSILEADESGQLRPVESSPDLELADILIDTVMNLLLAMQSRPELVVRQRKIKHLRRDRSKELWQPNIVGGQYSISRVSDSSTLEKGSHSSPRMHWRRGHFRRQLHGPGRQRTRIIWIEPCLVGA